MAIRTIKFYNLSFTSYRIWKATSITQSESEGLRMEVGVLRDYLNSGLDLKPRESRMGRKELQERM